MKRSTFFRAGLLCTSTLVVLLAGCITDSRGGRGGYRTSTSVQVQAPMGFEDDYDYYPGYEVYYSRNRHEYFYRDRNQWVRTSQPGSVSLNVLLESPSVRMDFRDSPERHHDAVVREYPRNWRPRDDRAADRRDKKRDDRRDNRNRKDHDKDRDDDDKDDRRDDRH